MISGCQDNQTSADSYNRKDKKWEGAMTKAFLQSLKKNDYQITCAELLEDMREHLKQNKFTQYPQLCSSNPISRMQIFCSTTDIKPYVYSK